MSITINGTGTITGISSGGLPDGVITTDDLANNAVTTAKLGTNEQSGLCRAWVNFNGTGTVAIRASFNVSSITDNGVGLYTVNFTTAMPDVNYAYAGFVKSNSIVSILVPDSGTSPTTSALPIRSNSSGGIGLFDSDVVCIAIFR